MNFFFFFNEFVCFIKIQRVTKKKLNCINHALGTMPIDKPLAHRETQLRAVGCYETVSSSRMEQQINLKFLVKLRETLTECFKLLKEIYGADVLLRTQIFE